MQVSKNQPSEATPRPVTGCPRIGNDGASFENLRECHDGRISLRVQLQTMDSLMDVLVTVSRVGASIESVAAANDQLELVALAREPIARRLPRLIEQVITVIAVENNLSHS